MKLSFKQIKLYPNNFVWINFVWFQIIWFVAVLYTQHALPVLILSLCAHFIFTPTRKADLLSLLAITLIGSLADYFLTFLGIFIFPDTLLIPIWLIFLWAHFALTLNHGMKWLSNIPIYARVLFGAVFGALSYYAGAELGAVTLHSNLLLSLVSLSVIWGSLLPVYIEVASFNRD